MKYSNRRVLYSVLDWGLGHATRSIPIIQELLNAGNHVTVASTADVIEYISSFLPSVSGLELPGYQVQYRWNNMAMNVAMKSPELCQGVQREHQMIEEHHQKHPFDAAISDQRYGAYIEGVPSFFITHQIFFKARKKLTTQMANKLHRQWMSQFDEVWIPDAPNPPGIGGILSHADLEQRHFYLGPVSRFEEAAQKREQIEYDWLFLLSGPQPARDELEEQLIALATQQPDQKFLIVKGCVKSSQKESLPDHIHWANHLDAEELKKVVSKSRSILSRSGYSTLMDLSGLRRKAALVPSPGQPEQLVLADNLSKQYRWPIFLQSELQQLPAHSCLEKAIPLPGVDMDRVRNLLHSRLSFCQKVG